MGKLKQGGGAPRGMGPPLNLPYIPRAAREPLWLKLTGAAMLLGMLGCIIAGGFIIAQIVHDTFGELFHAL